MPEKATDPIELVEKRQENTKTFDLGNGKRELVCSIGAIHYKDDYASNEQWKDIDLNWEGNKITKAPYELTLEGNKITIRDKKTSEVSTIELLEIGGVPIPVQDWEHSKGLAKALDTDLEIVAEHTRVRFARILKSDRAPLEAKFKVTGKIPFIVCARDAEDELPVESSLVDGILTETLKPDRVIKYPVRIDPTWQVGASTDDVWRHLTPPSFNLTEIGLQVGYWNSSNYQGGGGMRFINITIAQGATIDEAYLKMTARRADSVTVVRSRISAEDVDNAVTFADDAAAFDNRYAARTTARVDWDGIVAWTINTVYNSPEIKTIVQELVDRVGWASGNDQVWFWEDYDNRSDTNDGAIRDGWSYDGSTAKAPQLVITYTAVYEMSLTDGFSCGDTPTTQVIFEALATDGLTSSDTPVGSLTLPLSLSDGLVSGDTPTVFLTIPCSVADGVVLGDTPLTQAILNALATDGIKLSDLPTIYTLISLLATDGIKLGDITIYYRKSIKRLGDFTGREMIGYKPDVGYPYTYPFYYDTEVKIRDLSDPEVLRNGK